MSDSNTKRSLSDVGGEVANGAGSVAAKKSRTTEGGESKAKPSLTEPHPSAKAVADRSAAAWEHDKDGAKAYLGYTHLWLQTESVEATTDFYVNKLGWRLMFRYENWWVELLSPGGSIQLGFEFAPGSGTAPKTGVSIVTGSYDHKRTAAVLKANGIDISDSACNGPVTLRSFKDNNGYQMSIVMDGDGTKTVPPGDDVKVGAPAEFAYNGYANIKINTHDMDAAEEFYVNKLGCVKKARFGDMWMELSLPGDFTLGIMKVSSDIKPAGWRIGLGSNNLAKSRLALHKAGLTTDPAWKGPSPMKQMHFDDPDGNPVMVVAKEEHAGDLTVGHPDCVALRESDEMSKPWGAPKFGYQNYSLVWLRAKDMDETAKFYVRTLGWKMMSRWGNNWMEIQGPGGVTFGFYPRGDEPAPKDRGVSFAIGTVDMAKTVGALKKRGVKTFADAPVDKGPVILHAFTDPDGYSLHILGMGAPAGPPDGAKPDAASASGAAASGAGAGAGAGAGDESKADGDKPDAFAPWTGSDPSIGYNGYGNVTLCSASLDETQTFWEGMGARTDSRWGDMWLEMRLPGELRVGFEQNKEAASWPKADYDVAVGVKSMDVSKPALESVGVKDAEAVARFGPVETFRFRDNFGNRLLAQAHVAKPPVPPAESS